MKKLMIALMVSLAGASLFAANSIRWQVANAAFKGEAAGSLYFAYAMVGVKGTGAYLQSDMGYDEAIDAIGSNGVSTPDAVYSLIPTGYGEGNSFFVELYDASDELLAFSDAMSYDALRSLDAVYVPGIDGTGAVTWTVSAFNAPEPTSGLLMLLGFAGLALKRRDSWFVIRN